MKRFDPLNSIGEGSDDWFIAFASDRLIVEVGIASMPMEQRCWLIASAAGERDLCLLRAACRLPWD